eukprot:UN27357
MRTPIAISPGTKPIQRDFSDNLIRFSQNDSISFSENFKLPKVTIKLSCSDKKRQLHYNGDNNNTEENLPNSDIQNKKCTIKQNGHSIHVSDKKNKKVTEAENKNHFNKPFSIEIFGNNNKKIMINNFEELEIMLETFSAETDSWWLDFQGDKEQFSTFLDYFDIHELT